MKYGEIFSRKIEKIVLQMEAFYYVYLYSSLKNFTKSNLGSLLFILILMKYNLTYFLISIRKLFQIFRVLLVLINN